MKVEDVPALLVSPALYPTNVLSFLFIIWFPALLPKKVLLVPVLFDVEPPAPQPNAVLSFPVVIASNAA